MFMQAPDNFVLFLYHSSVYVCMYIYTIYIVYIYIYIHNIYIQNFSAYKIYKKVGYESISVLLKIPSSVALSIKKTTLRKRSKRVSLLKLIMFKIFLQ